MKSMPLFGNGIDSYSKVVTSQRRLNCFWDPRPDGDPSSAVLIGTPGSSLLFTFPTSPIRGWRVVNGVAYVVAGLILYSVDSNFNVVSLGTLNPGSGLVSISDNAVQLMVVDGVKGYILIFATSAFSLVTDANFPNGATTVAFINGRFIVNQPNSRQAWASASYDGATWTPIIFWTKENYSDNLLAVDVLNGLIIMWGKQSIEFWQDVGAAGLPYQRINGSTQTWGLAAVNSRAYIGNTMIFLGQNSVGAVSLVVLNGYAPTVVSTSDLDSLRSPNTIYSDAVALTYFLDGHSMYQITFPSAGRSFLYDVATNLWSETQTGTDLYAPHFGNLSLTFNSNNLLSDSTSGNVYILSDNWDTDNGIPIKRQVVSRHLRNQGNTFGIAEIFLNMETGSIDSNNINANPYIMVEVSKDGGRTYGIPRQVPLGKLGEYRRRAVFRRFGMSRDFVFRFTVTDPVNFVITEAGAVLMGQEN